MKASIEKKAEKEAKAIRAKESKAKSTPKEAKKEESDSDEEIKAKPKRKSNGTLAKKANGVKKEESDSDAPLAKKASAKNTNGKVKEENSPVKKGAKKQDSEEGEAEEEVYKVLCFRNQISNADRLMSIFSGGKRLKRTTVSNGRLCPTTVLSFHLLTSHSPRTSSCSIMGYLLPYQ